MFGQNDELSSSDVDDDSLIVSSGDEDEVEVDVADDDLEQSASTKQKFTKEFVG